MEIFSQAEKVTNEVVHENRGDRKISRATSLSLKKWERIYHIAEL